MSNRKPRDPRPAKAFVDIETPSVPNFLRLKHGVDNSIHIRNFSDADLRNVGRAWTQELIAKARRKDAD